MRNEPHPMYLIQYSLAGSVSMTSIVIAPDVAAAISLIELSLQDVMSTTDAPPAVRAHSIYVIDPLRPAVIFTAAM